MQKRFQFGAALAAALAGLMVGLGPVGPAAAQVVDRPAPGDPVTVTGGRVAGLETGSGVRAYLGIPFAAPPVEDRRWRPPAPVVPWTGVRHAVSYPSACMQSGRGPGQFFYSGPEPVSEDCLYLNLWTPAKTASARLPVVVWIYGGAFSRGSASTPRERGEALARKGVVYVAFNYRGGALGFLAHPELAREDPHNASGAYGFLDQVAALRWVQANIAAFGGDPDNVTVVGHSAGSVSVSALQASPLGRGLFHRAMGVSASSLTWEAGEMVPRSEAEARGLAAQAALNAGGIAEMRRMAADRIMQQNVGPPSIDGWFMPRSPMEIFAAREQSDVGVFVGFTRDEGYGDLFAARTPEAYVAAARAMYPADADRLLSLYPASGADWRDQARRASRDITLGAAMRRWAMGQTGPGRRKAYVYMFSRAHPFAPGVDFMDFDPSTAGAYHSADPAYWLNNLDAVNFDRETRRWTDRDRRLADRMSDMLVAFARTGDPSLSDLRAPPYDPADERLIELGDTIAVAPFPGRENVEFLHGLKIARERPAQN
ncbi:carboxylesterase family protein [Phenylobacterium sp. SCN 70-31]|uniref:carboxylesterase/lipase family protein n=1 Tax=Phenylobacterium sp. SCN 70-31 TaxID=1660129 RepID=UPI000AF07529|nr:carboxylesterase family protein [Phenylobacterium sp. SCN 70-31]